jgi:hypothetical protein
MVSEMAQKLVHVLFLTIFDTNLKDSATESLVKYPFSSFLGIEYLFSSLPEPLHLPFGQQRMARY